MVISVLRFEGQAVQEELLHGRI